MRIAIVFLALLLPAWAQDFKVPPEIEKLAAKADEVVNVTLDSGMLGLASRFLSDKTADEAQAKRIISGLKGIYVRSFEFAKAGEYSNADVEAIRAQLQPPVWSRVVGVQSKRDGENSDVYMKAAGGQVGGLVVISAEPKQLTIVNISGAIQIEDLAGLSGQFGIPKNLGVRSTGKRAPAPPPPPPSSKGKEDIE